MKGAPIVISAFLFVWSTIGMTAEEIKPDPREKPETSGTLSHRGLYEAGPHGGHIRPF